MCVGVALGQEMGRVSEDFFFNDTATTEIYTLSLHDALPISISPATSAARPSVIGARQCAPGHRAVAPIAIRRMGIPLLGPHNRGSSIPPLQYTTILSSQVL